MRNELNQSTNESLIEIVLHTCPECKFKQQKLDRYRKIVEEQKLVAPQHDTATYVCTNPKCIMKVDPKKIKNWTPVKS